MASEDEPRSDEGREENGLPATARSNGKEAETPAGQLSGKARTAERASPRARRGALKPPVNAIQASRELEKDRKRAGDAAPAPSASQGPAAATGGPPGLSRADSDPWTVPQSVRDRFVQDGHRFYFPDGAPAFKDLGRKLTTASENTQVVHSLIEIAHSRGWTEVTVTGTQRFRQEAWRQARLEGLAVRGYRPTDIEQAQLVRALARGLARPADSISADPQAPSPPPPEARREAPHPSAEERYVGRLLDHGKDTYLHDPDAEPSYFVRLGIPGGYREVWGSPRARGGEVADPARVGR